MPRFFLVLLSLFCFSPGKAQPDLQLELLAQGFTRPVDIANAGDQRLFIVEQPGRIRIIDQDGQVLPVPFLDITPAVSSNGELGLLGLAFHPGYPDNGYFFVNYTDQDQNTHIARFRVRADDPNRADPASGKTLLIIDQPYSNHNGGDLAFGPDGYLYIGLGDGGSGGDPQNNAQNRLSLLGKMLRIDVDNGDPYAIPPGNPFAEDDFTLDEIWALGLRNPWRFSFDRLTGDLWIGDVGQEDWEEVNMEPAGSPGGANYGWRCYEGNATYNTSNCPDASLLTFPVHVYPSNASAGCSVNGGFVYRGSENPELYGLYLYSDYCSGRFWSLSTDGQGGWINTQLLDLQNFEYTTMGEDKDGELYVAGHGSGRIYRIVERCSALRLTAGVTDVSCPGAADGSIDLSVNTPSAGFTVQWSTGSNTEDLSGLAGGLYHVTVSDQQNCERTDSILVEEPAPLVFSITANEGILSVPDTFAAYAWFFDGNLIPSAQTAVYEVIDGGGTYYVEVTDSRGCTFRSEALEYYILANPAALGFEELAIAPNPFRETVQVLASAPTARAYAVSLTDHSGRILWEDKWTIGTAFQRTLSLPHLPKGAYLFRIGHGGKHLVKTLIKY